MLERLCIRNFALVSSLELEFRKGLVLLTGETGAGKSLLIGALSSLLGSRMDSDLVVLRDEDAVIEGTFTGLDPSFSGALASIGISVSDSVTVRRKIEKKGRSSAFINGCAVSAGQLKEFTPRLLEINGQHQSVRLLDESSHAAILDSVDTVRPAAQKVRELSEKTSKLNDRYRLVLGKTGEIERRTGTLREEIDEISRVAPAENEDEELGGKRKVMQNLSTVMENLSSIKALLGGEETSVLSLLKEASKKAGELSEYRPKWSALARELEATRSPLAEIRDEAEREASDMSFEPGELERIEERLYRLEKLKRKYGPLLRDVISRLESARAEMEELSSLPLDREAVRKELDESFREYLEAAADLSQKRRESAPLLGGRIESALRPLALEKARFQVGFSERKVAEPSDVSEKGLEEAYFLFSANEGEALKPLSKIASGGEMSRTVLAILTSAGAGGGPDTVVFDEIDSGIGGRPAEKVGRYLSRLARGKQIICVTHLAQIAAFADQHMVVEKLTACGRTNVAARVLQGRDAREEELARMIAGEKVTETAKAHARELLKASGEKVPPLFRP
ncbi:MAG TPA: DNA repair protein RecN [Acidobacteriota bacterium]|jgi:DNA repair protein RecN (Recombination protein N)|nr:DNA repair protein RecN [Acidobacteriota bacterium]HNT17178.1 DNA repair protein RecN [Acidobacteriota bacterium]